MATRAQLAKIHIAKKELGLADGVYRHILFAQTGKDSSKDLSERQAEKVIRHFKSLGWKPRRSRKGRPLASDPQSRKIRALWITLHKMGVVKNSSERALGRYVKRMTGRDDLRWCDRYQKSLVIESLKEWQFRVEQAELEEEMRQINEAEEENAVR